MNAHELPSLPQLAHLAQVDMPSGLVKNIVVIPIEQGDRGHDYMSKDLKHSHKGRWIRFYPGGTDPKTNSVGPGSKYVDRLQAFVSPQPFPSWTLNESTFKWEAPVPRPGPVHQWDETNQTWYDPFTGASP